MVTQQSKSRYNNEQNAIADIKKQIDKIRVDKHNSSIAEDKRNNFGSGMRGDKTYTLRFRDNIAVCHANKKKMKCDKYMKGFMDLLW